MRRRGMRRLIRIYNTGIKYNNFFEDDNNKNSIEGYVVLKWTKSVNPEI